LNENDLMVLFCDYLECDVESVEGIKIKEYLEKRLR